MEPLKFTVQLEYEDYRKFWSFCINKRKRRIPGRLTLPMVITALLLVYLLWLCRQPGFEDFGTTAMLCGGMLLMLVILQLLTDFVLPRRRFKAYGSNVTAPCDWQVGESEIHCELHTDKVDESVRFAYAQIENVYETRDAFYIFTAKGVARIVPKRCLSQQLCGDLAAILQKGLDEKKYSVRYKKK